MLTYQILTIIVLLVLYSFVATTFCRRFTKELSLSIMLIFPIIVFSVGYIMRLSGNKPIIDIGYFFTDSSSIFLSALFTGALILGQLKYWKR